MSDHPLRRFLQKIIGQDTEATAIRESLEEVIEESDRESPALSAQERVMMGNLLTFGELKLSDVMVPRAEIVAVDENIGLADLLKLFHEAQHSRLPVYRETLDDPTGLIHVKDVLGLLQPEADGAYCLSPNARITSLRRPILFVPPSMRALDLLLKMQATHTHLALVIDEYGGTDGLVSIEDIIEEIVGDIADEHDEDAATVKLDGNGFLADARIDLDDFRTQTGHDLMAAYDDEDAARDIDSLGGLVVSLLGRVPQRGEIVPHPDGTEFLVMEADPRRVKKLRVTLPKSRATE
ncbi:MAG: hemolysin family protein [Rhizomicrobium sp.]